MEHIEIFLVILEQNYVPSKLTSHLSEFLGKQPRGQMLEIYRALSNIILQDFILTVTLLIGYSVLMTWY